MQQKTILAVAAAFIIFVAAAAFVSGWGPFQQKDAGSTSGESLTTIPTPLQQNAQSGKVIASAGDKVSVFYVGRLDDGTIFDTNNESVARSAGVYNSQRQYVPFEFTLGAGQVIAGFDRAVTGMKIGETKHVRIPPEEAYGNQGPLAGRALNFEIRLVSIG